MPAHPYDRECDCEGCWSAFIRSTYTTPWPTAFGWLANIGRAVGFYEHARIAERTRLALLSAPPLPVRFVSDESEDEETEDIHSPPLSISGGAMLTALRAFSSRPGMRWA